MTPSPLYIGIAGWSVPSRYAAEMPQGGTHLERYARRLNAAEINSSFYRPHQRKTYERWARSVPAGFRFSVKVPKAITHERRLSDCGALLDRFVMEVTGLRDKLGVLLVQLPPKLKFEKRVADRLRVGSRLRSTIGSPSAASRASLPIPRRLRVPASRVAGTGLPTTAGTDRCGGACCTPKTPRRAAQTWRADMVHSGQYRPRSRAWKCAGVEGM
jgi:hypothetical protein